jgi:sulfur carrier protein
MDLKVNGKHMAGLAGATVGDMLEKLDLKRDRVVVELNFEIIPRERFDHVTVQPGDSVEVVSFVGGG